MGIALVAKLALAFHSDFAQIAERPAIASSPGASTAESVKIASRPESGKTRTVLAERGIALDRQHKAALVKDEQSETGRSDSLQGNRYGCRREKKCTAPSRVPLLATTEAVRMCANPTTAQQKSQKVLVSFPNL